MFWLRGKIARNLALSYAGLALAVVLVAALGYFLFQVVRNNFAFENNRGQLAALGAEIRSDTLEISNLVMLYISNSVDDGERSSIRQEIVRRRARLDQLVSQGVELTIKDDLVERTLLARIEERIVKLYLQVNRLLDAYDLEQSLGPDTTTELTKLITVYQEPLHQEVFEFQRYENERVLDAQQRTEKVIDYVLSGLSIVVLMSATTALAMLVWSFRRIVTPLGDLVGTVEQLRAGKLDTPVKVSGNDEIGTLSETLGAMAAQLRLTLDGLHTNLAELQQMKAALEASEAHYRDLFDGVPVGMYQTAPNGQIIDANLQLVQMLGFPDRRTLLETNAVALYVNPGDRERWVQLMLEHDLVLGFEAPMRRVDGSVLWTRRNSRTVRDQDRQALYFEGSLEDITELRQAEDAVRRLNIELEQRVRERTAELLTANQELEAFSYSVSHDLRAPLRTIDGFSALLEEQHATGLDLEGQDYIHRMRAAAVRMGQLIDDLLRLSRVVRQEMRWVNVDLGSVAHKIIGDLQAEDPQRQIEWVVHPDLQVFGDAQLLQIVLENLLRNAWKFTNRKEQARIELGCTRQREKMVYFVQDNGAGFDTSHADKLFQPFQRLHSDREFEGTGIGLATVQRIIRRHGGEVWAEATPGAGAKVSFTLGTSRA